MTPSALDYMYQDPSSKWGHICKYRGLGRLQHIFLRYKIQPIMPWLCVYCDPLPLSQSPPLLVTPCAHPEQVAAVLSGMPQSGRWGQWDSLQLNSRVTFFGKSSLSPSQVKGFSLRPIIVFVLPHCNCWFTCLFLTLTLKFWRQRLSVLLNHCVVLA